MKHNDYTQIARCEKCGAWIYTPAIWHSKKFDKPSYPTCNHIKRKEEPSKPAY